MKDFIEIINYSKSGEYDKYYMKTKCSSDNDFPLNKQLNFLRLKIIIRNIFEKNSKCYPQFFLNDCLNEV